MENMSIRKKVLVTGATGFVGSRLVRRLLKEQYNVHIVTRKDSDFWRIRDITKRIVIHTADLTDEVGLQKTIKNIAPTIVFHLATAGMYGGASPPNEKVIKTNFIGFVNLITALGRDFNGTILNVGSSSEYGVKKKPMKETDRCDPMNIYGISKLAATHYAKFTAETRSLSVATFRLFSPFGPYDDYRRLISSVVLKIIRRETPSLINPRATRDFIFIDDVVDLFLEAANASKKFNGEVFNVGSGKARTMEEVVAKIARSMRCYRKIKWNMDNLYPWESDLWCADMSYTFKNFRWRPKINFDSGLKETIGWFKKNKELYEVFDIKKK